MSDIEFTFWRAIDTSQVKIFGISVGENDDIANLFVQSFGLTYPVLRDPSASVYSQYNMIGISPYPRDAIIDPAGILQYLNTEYDPQYMTSVLETIQLTDIETYPLNQVLPTTLEVAVFPNPTNSRISVEWVPQVKEPTDIELYDLTGRRVSRRNVPASQPGLKNRISLDLGNVASGMYLLSVRNGSYGSVRKITLVK